MRLLALLLALSGCGSSTACLYNPYDVPPRERCTTGLPLPGGLLKAAPP